MVSAMELDDSQDFADNERSDDDECVVSDTDNKDTAGNPQLADAIAKVLRMTKKNGKKSIVLSKAKLHTHKRKANDNCEFEIDAGTGEEKVKVEDLKPDLEDVKPDKKEIAKCKKISRQEKLRRGRLKPSVLDKEKERPLIKIATKGVVQLFNAVKQQQVVINKQIAVPGVTEAKKEKILKSVDKKAFLDVLMGPASKDKSPSDKVNETVEVKEEVDETNETTEPTWEILRDDFMMSAKLKDWDKKEDDMEGNKE